jgi:hypothetical protein
MTAYTKSTNFATKDTLTSGDPLKIVKGTEINTEFDNIATAVNSKSDTASPTFTGTVTIPTLAVTGVATLTAQPILSSLTASSAVATDASKGLVSVTNTGTGNNVLATSPTLVTPVLGAASATSITVDAGAVGTPSITTTGDTNTGIFFPAADTIAFAEGGAEIARFDSAGNLLVGTTTQATGALLTVNGSIKGTITSGTAVASTSGTSIDFTSIPSWVKRITVMFEGVSTNGTSNLQIQLGDSGGVETSGYVSVLGVIVAANTCGIVTLTSGHCVAGNVTAATTQSGMAIFANLSGNNWLANQVSARSDGISNNGATTKSLSATLDRIRITTVNGTDTFDAGSINILYEG